MWRSGLALREMHGLPKRDWGLRRSNLSELTQAELESILSGDPDEIDVHLKLIERDVITEGFKVKLHCHCMTVDANGKVQPKLLAEFMRNALADYAIPRRQREKARQRDAQFNSTSSMAALHDRARRTFTDLEKTGEGGEMLLFLLAERFLKLPQVLSKMDLKTDARMHYHGADGVYASVSPEGTLQLYWGESKIYADPTTAIRDCLASIAPFLAEEEHGGAARERDLMLLSDRADLSDTKITDAFLKYFDKTLPQSKRVEYRGVALIGFDAAFYPSNDEPAVQKDIEDAARLELKDWMKNIVNRVSIEKLDRFEIEFFCVPIPSATGFRSSFLEALGLKNE